MHNKRREGALIPIYKIVEKMKKLLITASLIGAAALTVTAKTSDPVVMTIDGKDVYLSEFEYLYNKNNSQQVAPVTFDEYVDMFVNYKLKVADALHEQRDTTESFRTEFDKFRLDLAKPYLRDDKVEQQLIDEAYDHYKKEVFVSHIMLDARDPQGEHKLDSICSLILSGEITFEDAARQNSLDKRSGVNGGRMAWMTGTGVYPWTFEKAAFDTPEGQISDVINSGVGYHLVRPEESRPSRGEVKVRHILLLTQGLDADAKTAVKAKADSLYGVVTAPGADFAAVATAYSQDPGSAAQGGFIDWFGPGKMVAEFDSISFALPQGAISQPFETSYGYHIVLNEGHRSYPEKAEVLEQIKTAMERDMRANMPVQAKIDAVAKATGSSINDNYMQSVREIVAANGGQGDSATIAQLSVCPVIAYTVAGKSATLGDVLSKVKLPPMPSLDIVERAVSHYVNKAYNSEITELEIQDMMQNNPEYRNLVNEYRDGILLFDVANKKVWEKASNDTEGLNRHFNENRDKYNTWTAPHFKGYVIFAPNDSTMNEISNYANTLGTSMPQDEFTEAMKQKFGKQVKVERVVVGKGDNDIIDYLAFGGPKPDTPKYQQWKSFVAFGEKIIDQPEEMTDVRGAVVTDYQNALEKEWVDDLHKTYKVKINDKVLKKAKK